MKKHYHNNSNVLLAKLSREVKLLARSVFLNLFLFAEPFWKIQSFAEPLKMLRNPNAENILFLGIIALLLAKFF